MRVPNRAVFDLTSSEVVYWAFMGVFMGMQITFLMILGAVGIAMTTIFLWYCVVV